MSFTRALRRALWTGALLVTAGACPSFAQNYPERPVRVVIPYGPGGATDIVTRIVFQEVGEILGQSFVVESRPGANGAVAIQEVATADPNGYTLMVGNLTTNSINPVLNAAEMPVDPLEALTPITFIAEVPNVLVATKVDFPPNTVEELIAYAKERPGELNHTLTGIGSYGHLDYLALQRAAGIELTSIPITAGTGGGQVDLVRGEVHIALINPATSLPLIDAGEVKPIAVTGSRRLNALPDIPTFTESGLPYEGYSGWQALFAPTGTPDEVIETLFSAVQQAVNSESVQSSFAEQEIVPKLSESPEELAGYLEEDAVRWEAELQEAGLLSQ